MPVTFVFQDSNDEESLKYCKPLKDGLIRSFDDRFSYLMKLENEAADHIVASVCHPKWKIQWLCQKSKDTVNSVKEMVIRVINDMIGTEDSMSPAAKRVEAISNDGRETNYFNFMKSNETSVSSENKSQLIEMEFLQYLADTDTSLRILHKYRRIRSLFLKFNAGIPSSAPVERLFSFAGLILSPRRSTLKDEMFEKCTLLKANQSILNEK